MVITTSDINAPKEPQRATKALTESEVDRRVELWHTKDSSRIPLAAYLGWTEDEYSRWVETSELPQS
jgi:hypothetical protein